MQNDPQTKPAGDRSGAARCTAPHPVVPFLLFVATCVLVAGALWALL